MRIARWEQRENGHVEKRYAHEVIEPNQRAHDVGDGTGGVVFSDDEQGRGWGRSNRDDAEKESHV